MPRWCGLALDVDFLADIGALAVEYNAFGRFPVSMSANCVEP